MSHKGGRRGHEEEHENHERWLVTYADMVTLLMVLFIVMFAMSAVDQKKFNALKTGLAAGFGQSTSILDGSSSILEEPGTAIAAAVAPLPISPDATVKERQVATAAIEAVEQRRRRQQQADARTESERLKAIRARLYAALRAKGLQGDVVATINERGLVVSLVSRHVVFPNDLAGLTRRGRRVVDAMGPVLSDLPDELSIDGHTNQVPVKPRFYPTDWELSSARSITVLRRLNEVEGIPTRRMLAAAFGHERPAVDPRKPGSQRINKRVDIVVLSDLPSETRALLETAARSPAARRPTDQARPRPTTQPGDTP